MKRCLIVDDYPDIAEMLQDILHEHNITSDTAETCNEAELKLHQSKFDFMIVDRLLPDGDGVKFAKRVSIPSIIYTGGEHRDIPNELPVLIKPADICDLLGAISLLLAQGEHP